MQDRSDSFWEDGSGLFDDPIATLAADERADADIDSKRLIDHAAVLLWLNEWGDELSAMRVPWSGPWSE